MRTDIDKLKQMMLSAKAAGIDVDANAAQILREVISICIATIGAVKTREILAEQYGKVAFLATADPGVHN